MPSSEEFLALVRKVRTDGFQVVGKDADGGDMIDVNPAHLDAIRAHVQANIDLIPAEYDGRSGKHAQFKSDIDDLFPGLASVPWDKNHKSSVPLRDALRSYAPSAAVDAPSAQFRALIQAIQTREGSSVSVSPEIAKEIRTFIRTSVQHLPPPADQDPDHRIFKKQLERYFPNLGVKWTTGNAKQVVDAIAFTTFVEELGALDPVAQQEELRRQIRMKLQLLPSNPVPDNVWHQQFKTLVATLFPSAKSVEWANGTKAAYVTYINAWRRYDLEAFSTIETIFIASAMKKLDVLPDNMLQTFVVMPTPQKRKEYIDKFIEDVLAVRVFLKGGVGLANVFEEARRLQTDTRERAARGESASGDIVQIAYDVHVPSPPANPTPVSIPVTQPPSPPQYEWDAHESDVIYNFLHARNFVEPSFTATFRLLASNEEKRTALASYLRKQPPETVRTLVSTVRREQAPTPVLDAGASRSSQSSDARTPSRAARPPSSPVIRPSPGRLLPLPATPVPAPSLFQTMAAAVVNTFTGDDEKAQSQLPPPQQSMPSNVVPPPSLVIPTGFNSVLLAELVLAQQLTQAEQDTYNALPADDASRHKFLSDRLSLYYRTQPDKAIDIANDLQRRKREQQTANGERVVREKDEQALAAELAAQDARLAKEKGLLLPGLGGTNPGLKEKTAQLWTTLKTAAKSIPATFYGGDFTQPPASSQASSAAAQPFAPLEMPPTGADHVDRIDLTVDSRPGSGMGQSQANDGRGLTPATSSPVSTMLIEQLEQLALSANTSDERRAFQSVLGILRNRSVSPLTLAPLQLTPTSPQLRPPPVPQRPLFRLYQQTPSITKPGDKVKLLSLVYGIAA